MHLHVVDKQQRLYVLVPVRLMFCNIAMEMRHYLFVQALELAVGLGLICSHC